MHGLEIHVKDSDDSVIFIVDQLGNWGPTREWSLGTGKTLLGRTYIAVSIGPQR